MTKLKTMSCANCCTFPPRHVGNLCDGCWRSRIEAERQRRLEREKTASIELIPNSFWVGLTTNGMPIYVAYRLNKDKPEVEHGWVIAYSCSVWDKVDRDWVFEPPPSHRDDLFLQNTRFSLEEARKLASEIMKGVPT